MSTPRIALVPLDERPACAELPRLVAAVAGVHLLTPPADTMPRLREPGDPDALAAWLAAVEADAAVVSLETVGHGGLIASRTRPATVASVTAAWAPLHALAARGVAVHAVTLITRTPDSADAMEEPAYWDPHGPVLHRLSADLHRGADDPAAVAATLGAAEVPTAVRADFLTRRVRNHAVNLAALELVADGTLRTLVVGADDTAEHGLATAELHWLDTWTAWLGLHGRVSVRPGADEACTVLLARTLLDLLGGPAPTVRIEAADPAGLRRTAAYENVPVATTATRQLQACGAVVLPDPDTGTPDTGTPDTGTPDTGTPDVVLLVHTPDGTGDWAVAPPAATDPAPARALAARAADLLAAGQAVAVADCAQPNGADPELVRALAEAGILEQLTAYAGWNTAGNTLGTVAAHTVTAVAARRAGRFDERAHRRLLLHRLVEDRGWMSGERARVRAVLGSDPTRHDHVPADHPVLADIAAGLARRRAELPGFDGLAVDPGSVRLPWSRTFEVDFTLTGGACDHGAADVAHPAPATRPGAPEDAR
ncbi:DUF4127 family protein [Kitasatospora phosalacinea]|uniref:DUF4127 family protein n=1 Tax=Kitasatospora phosalacinea TaxID=2065 RepID=A0A9W6PM32_9ACTN|nr:DUF4127 family protein [Kitasatospora phosalacinea]GLW57475.1 hypothetical protein Kpho01_54860 [Kitasatospora phosalacinea]